MPSLVVMPLQNKGIQIEDYASLSSYLNIVSGSLRHIIFETLVHRPMPATSDSPILDQS